MRLSWIDAPGLYDAIAVRRQDGLDWDEIRKYLDLDVPAESIRKRFNEKRKVGLDPEPHNFPLDSAYGKNYARDFATDKKVGVFNWREANKPLRAMQDLLHAGSGSQDTATIDFGEVYEPIVVAPICDWHFGSLGTDHDALERFTDLLLSTPNLYVAILGDMLQMSIKFRSVLEMADNALPPNYQHLYLESWLTEIAPKVLFSTWDNHSVMREEAQAGSSRYAELFKRVTIYHNGIGHIDIHLGQQTYKVAASHVFRGRSFLNPLHSQMRYLRMEAPDRDICMAGDSHVPALMQYPEGGRLRTVLNGGSGQINSGYGKRFFSLKTWDVWPCVMLDPEEHRVTPYWSVGAWAAAVGAA